MTDYSSMIELLSECASLTAKALDLADQAGRPLCGALLAQALDEIRSEIDRAGPTAP